jgi:hypothetical protein
LASKIKVFSTASNFALWFKASRDVFNYDEDVIFGIVYVPPENTRYSSNAAFAKMEAEYLVFSSNYNISLLGNFNGQISNDDDFILIDTNRHGDNFVDFINNDLVTLDELGIPRKRNNLDKVTIGYGNKLLGFCKGNSLFLLNGRVGEDQREDRLTCKKLSTVDYFLCSVKLLKCANNFRILEFSSLYSDVHSPLHITFSKKKFIENTDYITDQNVVIEKDKRNMQNVEQTLNRIKLIS